MSTKRKVINNTVEVDLATFSGQIASNIGVIMNRAKEYSISSPTQELWDEKKDFKINIDGVDYLYMPSEMIRLKLTDDKKNLVIEIAVLYQKKQYLLGSLVSTYSDALSIGVQGTYDKSAGEIIINGGEYGKQADDLEKTITGSNTKWLIQKVSGSLSKIRGEAERIKRLVAFASNRLGFSLFYAHDNIMLPCSESGAVIRQTIPDSFINFLASSTDDDENSKKFAYQPIFSQLGFIPYMLSCKKFSMVGDKFGCTQADANYNFLKDFFEWINKTKKKEVLVQQNPKHSGDISLILSSGKWTVTIGKLTQLYKQGRKNIIDCEALAAILIKAISDDLESKMMMKVYTDEIYWVLEITNANKNFYS